MTERPDESRAEQPGDVESADAGRDERPEERPEENAGAPAPERPAAESPEAGEPGDTEPTDGEAEETDAHAEDAVGEQVDADAAEAEAEAEDAEAEGEPEEPVEETPAEGEAEVAETPADAPADDEAAPVDDVAPPSEVEPTSAEHEPVPTGADESGPTEDETSPEGADVAAEEQPDDGQAAADAEASDEDRPEPEPGTEPEAEAEPEPGTEPEAEVEAEAVVEAEQEGEAEPEAGSETEAEPEAATDAEGATDVEAGAEADTAPPTETGAEPAADAAPAPEPEPEPEAPAEPDEAADAVATQVLPPLPPEPEEEPAPEAAAGPEPEAVTQPEPAPEPEPVVEPEPAPTVVLPPVPAPEPVAARAVVDDEDMPRPRRRRRGVALAVAAVVLVLLGGAYVGALWLWSERVPPGTTVAGVDIGGLSADEAVATLEADLDAAAHGDLDVAVGDKRTALDPAAAGLSFDAEATVEQVTGFGLEPARLWRQLFGAGPAEPVSEVDRAALAESIESVVETLSTPATNGELAFVDGAWRTTPSATGETLDVEASVELLASSWLTAARPLELPTQPAEPDVDDADVEEALTDLAEPLSSAPVRVEVAGQVAELPVDVLTQAAAFVPEDGELALVLDGPTLVDAVLVRTTDLLTAAEEPRFEFTDAGPVIVPGSPGTTLDPDGLAEAVAEAATSSGDRTAAVELVEADPAESIAELEALGIREIVSEFRTPLTSEPRRTRNIANGASKLNGMLIRPGEEFSLSEALGPIDAAHGFVQAGAIVNGEHTDAWGGGLSQMSTTTFNAAFFAGYDLLEFQPHSEWFRRYPEGRESTLFAPQIDLRWRNDTPYGALLQSWVADGYVYVRIWSTPYYTVETTTSGRSNVVQPRTVYSQSPTCEPQSAGNPGFRVTVTRTVYLDGVQKKHESWTTTYRPQNRIVCGPPPEEGAPEG